jgi:GT2 family glycosyltransferase
LLNNDAYPTSGWLKKMVKTIESKQKIFKIGFVGPSTNNCHSPQKNINTPEFALQYEDKVEVMKDPISGFCLLFRKALWEELKGFDEAFTLYGQESDFIFRAKSKGYFCVWRKDAFVWHDGESSVKAHGKNIEKERKRGRELYWAKRRLK